MSEFCKPVFTKIDENTMTASGCVLFGIIEVEKELSIKLRQWDFDKIKLRRVGISYNGFLPGSTKVLYQIMPKNLAIDATLEIVNLKKKSYTRRWKSNKDSQ